MAKIKIQNTNTSNSVIIGGRNSQTTPTNNNVDINETKTIKETPNLSGVTFYDIDSHYPHDTRKGCGLLSDEVDDNFYFLRGYDVSGVSYDNVDGRVVITRVNGEKLKTTKLENVQVIQNIITEIEKGIDLGEY